MKKLDASLLEKVVEDREVYVLASDRRRDYRRTLAVPWLAGTQTYGRIWGCCRSVMFSCCLGGEE